MNITARTILSDALKLGGIIAPGETMSADSAADGLRMLNDLVGSYNLDGLYAFATSDVTATFTGASATIGDGMTINTPRPIKITSAFYRLGGTDPQLSVITADEYYAIGNKTTSGNPTVIYYESTAPTGTVKVWPVPGSVEYHLQVEAQLTEFATLDTVYYLPPGYSRMLKYSMTEELAPAYGQKVDVGIARSAINMRRSIKRSNSRVPIAVAEIPGNSAESSRINILTNR